MREMPPPKLKNLDVFNLCVSSIGSSEKRERMDAISSYIHSEEISYINMSKTSDFHLMVEFNGKKDDVVKGDITQSELKDLYTSQMAASGKAARKYYDELRMSAHLNLCPFCGIGHVSTLDHYLPKSKFPLISVLPQNLVPSCADCNKGKNAGFAKKKEDQTIHPYFDHGVFVHDQWLFASVSECFPAVVRFKVTAPAYWTDIEKKRIYAHFLEFHLSSRYSIHASNELTMLRTELQNDFKIDGKEGVRDYLLNKHHSAENLFKNAWNTALYQALSSSVWYCSGGFLLE